MKKPVILMILDGFGVGLEAEKRGDAIKAAKKPNIDKLFAENPVTKIGASGLDVGLPDGQMGNSEVGHTNIGAGRIVYQELTRITKSIEDGEFFENEALLKAVDNAAQEGKALHIMGLLSNGGVHSHNTHMYAIVELAKKKGVKNVYVHAFLDGRDVPPTSGKDFVEECANKSVLARLQLLWVVIMQWIEIIVGIELKRLILQWFMAKATRLAALLRLLKKAMQTM